MNVQPTNPITIRRASGEWLAVSPPEAKFKIGTTGETEQEAVERFQTAWQRWTDTYEAAGLQCKNVSENEKAL
jgi:predicted RNase H-like HicB family nuclease